MIYIGRIPIFEKSNVEFWVKNEMWGRIIVKIWNKYNVGPTLCPTCGKDHSIAKEHIKKWLDS